MKIRRPLFVIAMSILVVIYAINTMPRSTIMSSLALFALFTIIHRITENKYTAPLVLGLVFALAGGLYFELFSERLHNKIDYLTSFDTVNVAGEITECDSTGKTAFYTVDVDSVNGQDIGGFKVIVYANDYFTRGMTLNMSGKFKAFTPGSNYIYNYSKGVFAYFYPDKTEVLNTDGNLNSFYGDISSILNDNAKRIFSYKTVPVAVAMGLGDKSLLGSDIKDAFIYTGLSHALVVSGLHVGFITAVLNLLLLLIPIKKKIKNIVVIRFLLGFMGIMGFQPSVVRAVVLAVALMLGRNFLVEIDSYTILALVIIFTLLDNPYSANNASLLLSYLAYFGVITAVNMSKAYNFGKIKTVLLITVMAQLFTSPVMAMLGMYVTVLSPLFNLLLSPVIMVICVLSFFLPMVYGLPFAGKLLCFIGGPVCDFLINILVYVAFFARENLSFAILNLGGDEAIFIVWISAFMIGAVFIQFNKSNARKIFIFVIPVLAFLCYNYINRDMAKVQVFDGSSQPAYVVSYKDENYLITPENINRNKLADNLERLMIDRLDNVIVCSDKATDMELYEEFSDNVTQLEGTDNYTSHIFSVDSIKDNRAFAYFINIGGCAIVFSNNKLDLSGYDTDFYFFGSDCPKAINSDNLYYFHPAVKATKEMISATGAVALYDVLTIKINIKTGDYTVVKDVKNFGSQL